MTHETATEHPYWLRRMRRMLANRKQIALVLTTKGIKAKQTMFADSKGDVEVLIGVYSAEISDAEIMADVQTAKLEVQTMRHYVRKAN